MGSTVRIWPTIMVLAGKIIVCGAEAGGTRGPPTCSTGAAWECEGGRGGWRKDRAVTIPSALYDNPATRWWARVTCAPEGPARSAPWQIGWRGWGRIYARAADGAMRDDYGIIASSIAFAAFLSILPLLGLVAAGYGMLVPSHVVASNIATLVGVLPGSAQKLVQAWLTNSLARHRPGGLAFLVSAVVTLFGARRAGWSLLHGINVASGVEQGRGPIFSQLVAIAVVLAGAGLLLTALVSISALALIQDLVPKDLPGAVRAFNLLLWGSLTLGPAVALVLTYRYASAREPVPWLWVLPGAATAVLLWLGATLAFRVYVGGIARYDSTYGSLSAVVVLQLWLMLSAYILLFGAKVNTEALRTAGVARGHAGERK